MDFSWTAEQDELYLRTSQLAPKLLPQVIPDFRQTWRACGDNGLLGLCAPRDHGGLGLDAVTTSRVVEALGRGGHNMGVLFSILAHMFTCSMPIAEFGDEAQRQRYLPKLTSGEWVGANAISETEAGSDVFAIQTRAQRQGDRYVINGSKLYVTNGPVADLIVLYAVTNPAHGFMGVSAFLLERTTPGLTIGKPFQKMGLTDSQIAPIFLENAELPVSARLGAEGRGGDIFKRSMRWERCCLFASYLGLMEQLLDQSVRYAKQRKQFKKPISKNQAISHKLVGMKARLESARLLLYRAAWKMGQGQPAELEISLAKLAVSEGVVQSSLDAIQIHGGMGYMAETGVERSLRDAIPSTLFSGTSEIQRDLIARELGL